ncbi:MAG: extracellular solute-binding protein [Clostridiales bacterium]|jgi:multiple sugar transport system substrate-binding protein|nr:extracellular solute-binding protein [Clostridiales bacterium]
MKKALLSLLILALLVFPFTGCGAKTAQSNGELTIAAFNDSEFLTSAARQYEEAHEGVTVNITFYAGEEKDVSKYAQIINTALMSGKGEDIMDVSRITWAKLADKNKLLDLNGLIQLDSAQYYQDVLDAFLYKGKRYAIPLCFMFEMFQFDDAWGDEEAPADFTIDGLLALADKYPETTLFNGGGGGMGPTALAYKLFSLEFKNFLDMENKIASVDNEKFISLLQNVQSLAGRIQIKERGDTSLIRQYMIYSPAMSSGGTVDYADMFLMTNELGQAGFETSGFLPSINANSVHPELAADFIRYLLSEEIQSSPELICCPVNKNAAAALAKLVFGDVSAEGYAPDGFDDNSLERNIQKFNEFARQLGILEYADHVILDFVNTEMNRYFQGEESAEQAAKNLQSRLNTYLTE